MPARLVVNVVLSLLAVTFLSASARPDLLATTEGRGVVFDALVGVFREFYWDEARLDWDGWAERYREDALSAPSRRAFDMVARRMVGAVTDEHSSWLGLVRYADGEEVGPAGTSRLGLGFSYALLDGAGMLVLRVFPQTPAAASGLRRGDVIVRVGGEEVGGLLGASPGELLGAAIQKGEVALELRRKGERLDVTLQPAPVQFEIVRDMPQAEMLDGVTGYLYLPSFNRAGVAERVHSLVAGLQVQGAKGLVLDMRGNLGGRLSELGLVLGAFVEGPWAQAVSREALAWRGEYRVDADGVGSSWLETPDGRRLSSLALEAEPARFAGPVVVIVDAHNSSAGEIGPLVLQALGRAAVVGEPTGGNVEVIRGFDLPDGSLVFVAVANLQGLKGESFDEGVRPDVYARESFSELARGFDAPVAEALRLLRGLPFTPGRFF